VPKGKGVPAVPAESCGRAVRAGGVASTLVGHGRWTAPRRAP
jgi:hypothetical protein